MIAAFPNISNVFCVLMALFYERHNGARWFCGVYSSCCFTSHSSSCPDQRKVSLQCISKEPPSVPSATCHKRLHMISVLHWLQRMNCTSGHFLLCLYRPYCNRVTVSKRHEDSVEGSRIESGGRFRFVTKSCHDSSHTTDIYRWPLYLLYSSNTASPAFCHLLQDFLIFQFPFEK